MGRFRREREAARRRLAARERHRVHTRSGSPNTPSEAKARCCSSSTYCLSSRPWPIPTPPDDAPTKAGVAAAWTDQHQFGGALLDEHLGQLLAIGWSIAVSVLVLRTGMLAR
jgi:hypothetical protein